MNHSLPSRTAACSPRIALSPHKISAVHASDDR
jgi:hypothetical protein